MPPARESRGLKMSRLKQGLTRVDLLIQGAAPTGLLAAGAAFGQGATNSVGVKNTVLHMIGHSHIDAAWLWPWRDGADSVLDTFRSALNRMNETPGFCYSHSSAAHYRWVERAAPEMVEQIKQRIQEQR